MTLRTRPYLHYAPVPGGVYFSGSRTQFVLRGPELLFKIVDVCVPLLEVGTTEDELVAALGAERVRPVVRRLVAALGSHGLLLDLDRLTVPAPPDEVRARYPESLAYLESAADDPYAVFARIRAATVLLAGPATAMLPAARGLARAGVGTILLAVPGSPAVPSVADLGAQVRMVGDAQLAGLTDVVDAVIDFLDGGDPAGPTIVDGLAWRAPAVQVPVRLQGSTLLVGPAIRHDRPAPAAGPDLRAPALLRRASSWAAVERVEPAVRPSADALAGALAGQLVFDLLAGLPAEDGAAPGTRAHLVYGDELTSETLVVPDTVLNGSGEPPAGWCQLDRVAPTPLPDVDVSVGHVQALATRWTGLFALQPGADLPQLPLALRVAEHRAGGPGPAGGVVGWAETQQSATIAVALEILRGRCAAGAGVAAAGLSEERWLLDGVLRLLAGQARVVEALPAADSAADPAEVRTDGVVAGMSRRGHQITQALAEYHRGPLTIQLCQVPGLDWRLARICAEGGDVLGSGWGRDRTEAVEIAAGAALARVQAEQATSTAVVGPGPCTNALLVADDLTVAALRRQVSAGGARYRGRPVRSDPVLGPLPLWFGRVEAYHAAGQQAADPAGEPADG